MDGRNWKEDRFHGKKAPKFPWDIWDAVRFVFKYSILRELSFITLPAFLVFGNQIARFSKRTAHLALLIVRKGSLNRKKSQSKIDQDFRRNRKTAKKGVIVIFIRFAGGSKLDKNE
ncbi:hypothetical protein DWU89_10040 [Parabacteroides acidifaciens]|uniref:Uncharacterized protein n=1 Tax=Parabacteroides acidifaciens TaxID=2290935 RepID=A0A3D8HE47_9BACT|nr:hypothetical protein DWU89_10040 [Parabacteroides acidifaciens]